MAPRAVVGTGQRMARTPRRGHVFCRYAVICVGLVSGALLMSGFAQAYFSYQDTRSALGRIQQEQAASAAYKIAQFVAQIAPPIRAANQTLQISATGRSDGAVQPGQRRDEYAWLLRTLDIVQRCYTGLEARDGVLWLNPQLPTELGFIDLDVLYRRQWLSLRITDRQVRISAPACTARPIRVGVAGRLVEVQSGQPTPSNCRAVIRRRQRSPRELVHA
jgi:Glycosyl hydrolase family 65, C-terminal domain